MDRKSTHIIVLSVFISLLLCGTSFSLCYEATGGRLQSGPISNYLERILISYEKDVPDGAVYTVQKKQGHYFKICDEPLQVSRFMEKWAEPEVSNGIWQPILTTKDKNKTSIVNEIGIYKIQKENNIWKVWKYVQDKTQKVSDPPELKNKMEGAARKKTKKELIEFHKKSIEDTRQKAIKLSANPVPVCMEEKKLLILGKDTKFTSEMSGGKTLTVKEEAFTLTSPEKLLFVAHDLICNICEQPVLLKKIELKTGDCLHIREKMIVKKENFISFENVKQ